MSFVGHFDQLPIDALRSRARDASDDEVSAALAKRDLGLADLAALLSPAAAGQLEPLAKRANQLTQQRFGKVIRLFAPLYLSNECINNCQYCGFSRDNPILRVTLSVDEVVREARALAGQGFRNVLLVAGEHPKFISGRYMADCVEALRDAVPSISLEVGPMETDEYRPLVEAGAEGLIVYQETYHREVYAAMHTSGPKRNFDWRLECPERAYAGGFRQIGIGALFGLADWHTEALALAAHLEYLHKHCWKAQFTISFPRLRPHAGNHRHQADPALTLTDRNLVQLICAFRLTFPQVGIVLSTREPANLRDKLFELGVTHISAGSHTEPGGYTGAGSGELHRTVKGRSVELEPGERSNGGPRATPQFESDDHRTAAEVAAQLRAQGFDPVWKDWDSAILAPEPSAIAVPSSL